MKVELINPSEVQMLFHNWGTASKCCYNTETNNPDTIGKACMNSGHFSGSRGDFIKFYITDVPRFTVDQAIRHSIGTFTNVQSFRYVNKNSFIYEIPTEILDNETLLGKYHEHMTNTIELYGEIQDYVYDKTNSHERANEQARYVLPMATHSSFVFGLTVEALIHFCNSRLCVRAEDKIRELARLMKKATIEVLPEIENELVPRCQANLWCSEGKHSCGAYPTKKELKEMIQNAKC